MWSKNLIEERKVGRGVPSLGFCGVVGVSLGVWRRDGTSTRIRGVGRGWGSGENLQYGVNIR